ncbi:MAG: PRD domain-containing protein, partial [Candidatus Choladocola sp.]|nr:PRD domain-containing protein [Candidatus Choladocola sp.]
KNPLSGPVMCYYPEEYRLGKHCLQMIEERCHVNLNEDEATFIALHIVNAELNTSMSQMYDITRMLDGCIRVVEFYYRRKRNEDSVDFSRFVVHLRYLIFRLFRDGREENRKKTDSKTEERDELFRQMIMKNCREHYECAQRIASYVETNFEKQISEDERIYLTIHLKRLNTEDDGS